MTSSDREAKGLEKIRATCLDRGWIPRTWDEVLVEVRRRLPENQVSLFLRYHRSFTAYPTEATLKKFYGLVYAQGLGDLMASYRFPRLTRLLAWLQDILPTGQAVLEVGAGAGQVLHWIHTEKQPQRLSALDWVPEAKAHWPKACAEPQANETFDCLLCFDALGETHSDDDDTLSSMHAAPLEMLTDRIEQRYGFAAKLAPLRRYLGPGSHLYLTEPIPHLWFWNGLAFALQQEGWSVSVLPLPRGLSDPEGFGLKIVPRA
jgi:hypothetical protein